MTFFALLRTVLTAAMLGVAVIVCAQPKGLPLSQSAKTPTLLSVESADKKQITLGWVPADAGVRRFNIERRELPDGGFQSIRQVAEGDPFRFQDTAIDAFTPYAYRVVPITRDQLAAPSNEVAAGPPLPGYHRFEIASFNELPYGGQHALCQDENEDPVLAFVSVARQENVVRQTIEFVRWRRDKFAWSPPVRIDTLAPTAFVPSIVELSLARDRGRNRYGITYRSGEALWLALSENGLGWKREPLLAKADDVGRAPRLALFDNMEFITYSSKSKGLVFGRRIAGEAAFNEVILPAPVETKVERGIPASLAISSNGQPGVVYACVNGKRIKMVYFEPLSDHAVPMLVGGMARCQASLALGFDQDRPWIAAYGSGLDGIESLRIFDRKQDSTWSGLPLPQFAEPPSRGPLGIATGSRGERAFLLGRHDELTSLPRPVHLLANASWGRLSTIPKAQSDSYRNPALAFCTNGLLYVAFQNDDPDSTLGLGLTLWREPPR